MADLVVNRPIAVRGALSAAPLLCSPSIMKVVSTRPDSTGNNLPSQSRPWPRCSTRQDSCRHGAKVIVANHCSRARQHRGRRRPSICRAQRRVGFVEPLGLSHRRCGIGASAVPPPVGMTTSEAERVGFRGPTPRHITGESGQEAMCPNAVHRWRARTRQLPRC